jgi:thymidylate kinase
MMIALDGPDMCGKTQICKELAASFGLAYYKNSGEWSTDLRSADYFKNVLTYGATIQTDLLCQVKPKVVLDRYYPSEWVYSKVFKRESNEQILEKIDEMFAGAGGRIVICRRKSYEGIRDDLHSYVDSSVLQVLDQTYAHFTDWTKCKVMTLWVDDENLERQVSEIRNWCVRS